MNHSGVDVFLFFILKRRVVQLVGVELEDRTTVLFEFDFENVRVAVMIVERVAVDLLVIAEVQEGEDFVFVAADKAVVPGAEYLELFVRFEHGPTIFLPGARIEKIAVFIGAQHAHAVAGARRRARETAHIRVSGRCWA